MLRSFLFYLSERKALGKFFAQHALGRRMTERFIAGQDLEDALQVVRRLNGEGFDVTLDHLGESVTKKTQAEEACGDYVRLLDRLAEERVRSHISVKLTQLGLAIDEELARRHLAAIAARAAQLHNFVRIDMEGSFYTEKTLRLFLQVNAPRHVLGIVIQAYLYRSEKDVDELLKWGARIRLVKGAYHEPPEVAFPRKADVDRNFLKLMEKLLASGGLHAIATHDPPIIAAGQAIARARGLTPDQFEFQMLFGIRRRLLRALVRQGYRVRIYVPFGKEWYPYFMRRLAERPANLLFLLRNLLRA